ncbi:MAG: deoxyribose-phosphate aldolase [Erysipelotrichaceae bacterium]|nr:deoxyribose-phosphate aldolase [Erysipelotrichaceae bacterium]
MTVTRGDVERIIDASIGATPAPTMDQVEAFVRKTLNYNFAVTLTEPYFIKPSAEILHAAGKKIVTVISYPLGSYTHEAKLAQLKKALADGADECDIALDVSAFKSGEYEKCKADLKPCVEAMNGKLCKLLYFASLLTEEEQKKAVDLAIELGFNMLKTNPGYGFSTTVDQVKLAVEHAKGRVGVMVSGGVRTKDDAIKFVEAGACRIATSAAFDIMAGFDE